MHIYFDDSDFLMGIILKLELMDVHTRPESVCFVSNVSTFIKNQKKLWDSALSVHLIISTCGFEDPIAIWANSLFVPDELSLNSLCLNFRTKYLSHTEVTHVTIALDCAPGKELLRSIYQWFVCSAVFFFFFYLIWSDAAVLTVMRERGALLQIMPDINLTLPHIFRVRVQSYFMSLSSRLNFYWVGLSPTQDYLLWTKCPGFRYHFMAPSFSAANTYVAQNVEVF